MGRSEKGDYYSTDPPFKVLRYAYRLCDDLTAAIKAAFAKQEFGPQTRFHEQFRKVADEYDRDFHQKYCDDLNTTMIFVRPSPQHTTDSADKQVGRSLLCRSVGFHRRHTITNAPGLQSNELRCSHHASKYRIGGVGSASASYMVWSRSLYRSGSNHPLQLSRECFAGGIPGYAREAMAELPRRGIVHRP